MKLRLHSPFAKIGVGTLTVLATALCDVTARVQLSVYSENPSPPTKNTSDVQASGEDSDNAESEEERYPVDGNALNSGALAQSERDARRPLARSTKARTVERRPNALRRQLPGWRRIDRVVAESDCVTHTLAVMAPAIRSHGPPLHLGWERSIDSRRFFQG